MLPNCNTTSQIYIIQNTTGYILKPSRPRNKSHGKELGPVYKTLFYSSVLLPKVNALYSVNTGKIEDIA